MEEMSTKVNDEEADAQGAGSRRPKSKVKTAVCTSCRQSKVRCMGSRDGTCDRCLKLGLSCLRDSNFKRVSRDRKLAELERQVEHLVSAKNALVNQVRPTSLAPLSLEDRSDNGTKETDTPNTPKVSTQRLNRSHEATDSQQHQTLGPRVVDFFSPSRTASSVAKGAFATGFDNTRPLALTPRSIEGVNINTQKINDLFQIFFEHYHAFLPFLEPEKSPDDYHALGETLFWAIISVASRRYQEDVTLLHVLADSVMKLLWAEISKPPYKLSLVQATIILSVWPFPTTITKSDISITLSSLAISMAMQAGLHRPTEHTANISVSSEWNSSVSTRTWAVANIVSQCSASVMGHLPHAPFDWTIDRACENENARSLPEDLRLKLVIQRYCNRITKLIWDVDFDQIPVDAGWVNELATLEKEMNALDVKHSHGLTSIDQLYLAAAQLYLHSFNLFDSSPTPSRKARVLQAYTSALNLVSLFSLLDAAQNALLYLPYHFFRMLLIATCTIFKILKSSYASEVGDYETGRKTLNEAIIAIHRSSVANNDTGGKAVRLISQMWHSRSGEVKSLEPPELMIRNRGGASIVADFTYSWRMEFRKSQLPAAADKSPAQHFSAAQFPTSFEKALEFDMDFLEDPSWNFGLEEPMVFA